MYKVVFADQAEVFFPSFEKAISHMKDHVWVSVSNRYVKDVVECGNIFRSGLNGKEATLEKVSI